eukprot:TRINITY_DN2524_c0_g1_i1.p1 TRINITY_DN2524_c0_g1~~TRINITY_DN2524_c0_g1_i1.p1  ORF type:complete len:443 (+),score=204.19 TRINITY_DN2524_c0_g1_i1:42-1331(+)
MAVSARTLVQRAVAASHSGSVRFISTNSSLWSHLNEAPLDGNHATAHAFDMDKSPLKVNLGRGVYKDDNGKDWVLPSVRGAEDFIAKNRLGHEYLPFSGLKAFTELSSKFAFGSESEFLADKRVGTVQTISGTGALRVGAEFLSRFLKPDAPRVVYIPNPSYVNHVPIFKNTGFEVKYYRYYDKATNGLDLDGMIEDIKNAPRGSTILLHACAHNPTGIDPAFEQWKKISDQIKESEHVVFFDCAYQGFASGDSDRDAQAFRYFVSQGHQILLAQSYSKNFGLYGQRVGALNVVTKSAEETKIVLSQLNQVIRPMYSNPSLHGARIVSTVFSNNDLAEQWKTDVKTMAHRIIGMREQLVSNLAQLGSVHNWDHISNQIGMFAYSGLTPTQVQLLRELHVYMNLDGRMSITGINSNNVKYLAEAIHKVTV